MYVCVCASSTERERDRKTLTRGRGRGREEGGRGKEKQGGAGREGGTHRRDVCTLKYYSQMKYRAGPRRHTARAYIFRPYINTRIIMNARARSVPSLSLSLILCIVRSVARERRVRASGTREFLLCTRSFLPRSSHSTRPHGGSLPPVLIENARQRASSSSLLPATRWTTSPTTN